MDRYDARLTSTQTATSSIISSAWSSLAGPTVVVLDAPAGRGKTRIVQDFYDSLVEGQLENRRFWGGKLANDDLQGWRQNRKSVGPGPVDVTQRPDWLWLGLEGYPFGRVDLPSQVHRINDAVVKGYEEGRLPVGAAEALRRGPGRGILLDLLRATTDIVADLIPGGGLAKTGIETTIAIGRAITARNDLGLRLSVHDPIAASRAVLATMFVASALGNLDTSLAPLVVAVDDAHLVDPSAVAVLDAIVRSNPDDELLGSGVLRGPQREFAASRGLPPAVPVLILATSQPLDDSQPDEFGAKVAAWGNHGLKVIVVGGEQLPLLSEDDAIVVAERRLARTDLGAEKLQVVVDHAHDHILEGVNASLLIAHCERVARLSDPNLTLTPAWADRHLPRYIEEDARLRFDALTLRAQEAVVAGSLRGAAFAWGAVSTISPTLGHDEKWVEEVEYSGYAVRSTAFPDAPQLVFSDEPSFAYARTQAVRDSALCTRALSDVSAPLLRNFWASATVGPSGGGRALYELSRREAYQYQQLVREADLRGDALDPDVWAATLGFGAEAQFMLEEIVAPAGAHHMRDLWRDLTKGTELLSGDGWAIAARWVVHRHLPGPMTFGSVWSTKSSEPQNLTRLNPKAREAAARVAGRILPLLLANDRPLFEPGLRLLLRLGLAGRLLPSDLRRLVASRLLMIAPLRLSAAVVLARVYTHDLDRDQRELLFRILISGPVPDSGDASVRRSLALAWLGHDLPVAGRVQVVDDLVAACRGKGKIFEEDAFGVLGRTADVSDPIIFPWAHTDIYAAAALLTSAERLSASTSAQTTAAQKLQESMETHPGAAWLLSSGKVRVEGTQLGRARTVLAEWDRRGALPAGRFDLTGSVPSTKQPKKGKKQRRR